MVYLIYIHPPPLRIILFSVQNRQYSESVQSRSLTNGPYSIVIYRHKTVFYVPDVCSKMRNVLFFSSVLKIEAGVTISHSMYPLWNKTLVYLHYPLGVKVTEYISFMAFATVHLTSKVLTPTPQNKFLLEQITRANCSDIDRIIIPSCFLP